MSYDERYGGGNMDSRTVLIIATVIGLCCIPILFRKKYRKRSLIIFVIAVAANALLENYLITKDYLYFPVRYFPGIFKNNIMYDYLVCPLISVAYCQTSSRKKLIGVYAQGIIYSVLQTLLEYFMLTQTELIRYNDVKWSIWHTLVILLVYKIIFIRGIWELLSYRSIVKDR
jgi:hypothetical protein